MKNPSACAGMAAPSGMLASSGISAAHGGAAAVRRGMAALSGLRSWFVGAGGGRNDIARLPSEGFLILLPFLRFTSLSAAMI
jgi:hypothetical protein